MQVFYSFVSASVDKSSRVEGGRGLPSRLSKERERLVHLTDSITLSLLASLLLLLPLLLLH